MVELRDYQQRLLEEVQGSLANPSARVMLQLPTGGGKTRIAGELLRWWLNEGNKAVWLTHRNELSYQTCRVLNGSGVSAVNSLKWDIGDAAPARKGGVVILMTDTVSRRNRQHGVWANYNERDLLVIDEAHHSKAAGWERAIGQWPGPVVGLTATPWRLSKIQGFNQMFSELLLGPQINELQAGNHLAHARVLMPETEDIILGGQPSTAGDYTEAGIESANRGRNIWTTGTVRFWQEYAQNRQTIVYAVSIEHAENLTSVFREAGVSAAMLLGNTPSRERTARIKQFSEGALKVLVNVAVATEGFDLPDASCVVLTRPTMSLALYLQMVGRGLRPKSDHGDCLILDLAGNVERHGFPEDDREWSLKARGIQGLDGSAPVVRCPHCSVVSPASSHYCRECDEPFGKYCGRCGRWRAWQTWSAEFECGDEHDLVCNRCHIDAHELGTLPEGLKEKMREELNEEQLRVNPLNLQTLDEFRSVLSEAAEALTCAYKVDDFVGFNRRTKEIRQILRQERKLQRAAQDAAGESLKVLFTPLIIEVGQYLQQIGYDIQGMECKFYPREDFYWTVFQEGDEVGEDLTSLLTLEQLETVNSIVSEWIEKSSEE